MANDAVPAELKNWEEQRKNLRRLKMEMIGYASILSIAAADAAEDASSVEISEANAAEARQKLENIYRELRNQIVVATNKLWP